ncbi:MAG: DUF2802 domain-containing protein, partial [Acidiferrobacterales bacterium]
VLAVAGQRAQRHMQAHQHAMLSLQTALTAIHAEVAGLTERLGRVEREIVHVSESTQRPARQEIYDHSYAVAARLVREGADAADLAASCGLVRGEAELMMRLYGTGAAKKDVAMESTADKPGVRRPARRVRAAGYEVSR